MAATHFFGAEFFGGEFFFGSAPPTEESFGGYGPILRVKRRDDDGDMIAILAAFLKTTEE